MLRQKLLLLALFGFATLTFLSTKGHALAQAPPCGGCACPWTAEQLTHLSWCELEAIYRQTPVGPLPCGFARGRLIYGQDKRFNEVCGHLASVWWKGKHLDPVCGTVMNQWAVGKAVPGRMCYGPSRIDGQPSVILDYSDSWRSWQNVRDEARQLCPGLYLGAMFVGCEARPKVFFVLEIEYRMGPMAAKTKSQFLMCLNNEAYPVSLEARKIYQALPDAAETPRGMVRVIDESGAAYLYPHRIFVAIELPRKAASIFRDAS